MRVPAQLSGLVPGARLFDPETLTSRRAEFIQAWLSWGLQLHLPRPDDILGDAGSVNVQGEDVKKLDVFANDQFTGVLRHGISCAGIASEELDEFVAFDDTVSKNSKYVCLFDPLDGSGNIDVNVSIGTIFCIYRRVSDRGTLVTCEDFLQKGRNQVAAGYIVYGSSTMMVYATRRGVNGFTLDPSIGEFTLSHRRVYKVRGRQGSRKSWVAGGPGGAS